VDPAAQTCPALPPTYHLHAAQQPAVAHRPPSGIHHLLHPSSAECRLGGRHKATYGTVKPHDPASLPLHTTWPVRRLHDNLRALVLVALAASPRDGLDLVARSAMVGSLAPPARATNLRAGAGGFVAVRRTGNEASGAAAAAGGHDGARVAGRRRSRALQRPRCTYLRLRRRRPSSAGGVKWPISGWAYSRRRCPNRRFLSCRYTISTTSASKPGAGSARIGPAGAPPPESQYDRRPAFRSPNFRTRAQGHRRSRAFLAGR